MPYISKNRRMLDTPTTAGELNFAITRLCTGYLGDGVTYARVNEIVGALECAKLEFYRRIAVPYEETKRAENGDVY